MPSCSRLVDKSYRGTGHRIRHGDSAAGRCVAGPIGYLGTRRRGHDARVLGPPDAERVLGSEHQAVLRVEHVPQQHGRYVQELLVRLGRGAGHDGFLGRKVVRRRVDSDGI